MVYHKKIQLMADETIAAIATPPGRGGVAIIRLSGSLALSIVSQLIPQTTQFKLTPRQAIYVHFIDEQNELIDDGIVLYFKAPHSFTGEDVVELQCHGSPIVLDCLLKRCITLGARLANPGEFSQRAFLNDKMDLAQAEAVADLINASSQTAARMAVKSLQGEFSKKINELNEKIIQLRLFIEATIDFPDEDIDFLSDGKVAAKLSAIIEQLDLIHQQAVQGALLREGLSVVIAGPPNAGKSTLINQLAGREVAIVTDIPGTTRDVMREHILIDDLPIHIIDTAGLRESDDIVEREGIKRALAEVKHADCILWVTDVRQKIDIQDEVKKNSLVIPVIEVMNKTDTTDSPIGIQDRRVYLSARTGDGIELLKTKIKQVVGYKAVEGVFLARRRHLQALDQAHVFLNTAQQQLKQSKAAELLAEDLRLAHVALAEITGEFTSDDLLGKIFSTFCIGK